MVENAFELSKMLSIYLIPTKNVQVPSENVDTGNRMVALIYESDPEILLERYGSRKLVWRTGNLLGRSMFIPAVALPSAPYPSVPPPSACLSAWVPNGEVIIQNPSNRVSASSEGAYPGKSDKKFPEELADDYDVVVLDVTPDETQPRLMVRGGAVSSN